MPKIAIIDDDEDQSKTLALTLQHHLENLNSDLKVITQMPFKKLEDYMVFIQQNDVCVLILDEKLNVKPADNGEPVQYLGNQLVTFLREQLKEFPIFMVSNYIGDEELQEKAGLFDHMFTRTLLTEDESGKKYVPIIVRSAQRYLNSNDKELSEFNELTQEIAAGDQSSEKLERLQALQVKLQIPFASFDDRSTWLEKYEQHIDVLSKLEKELQTKLDNK